MRLAIINLVPTPYREPLYEQLGQSPHLTLRVFYLQAQDSLRGWAGLRSSYDAVRLPCLTPEALYSLPAIGLLNPGLIRHLRRFQPDCLLVHGYSYLPQMQAMRWAIRRRVPYVLCADSNAHSLGRSRSRFGLKEICVRYFSRHAAGVLVIGSLNEQFWSHYGVEAQRRFWSPLAVDNDFFAAQAERWRPHTEAQRQALGLPGGRILLFVGRFAPEKNLENLLRAMAACGRRSAPALSLVLVGDGPEKMRLERLAAGLNLSETTFFFGFQPLPEIARFYAIADGLVLPSTHEPWGLVVNEAMASGLPVLLSRSTGCLPDLLEEERNGFSFDEKNVDSISDCLIRFSQLGEEPRRRMGLRSAEKISRCTLAEQMAGIFRALEAVSRPMSPRS